MANFEPMSDNDFMTQFMNVDTYNEIGFNRWGQMEEDRMSGFCDSNDGLSGLGLGLRPHCWLAHYRIEIM